MLDFERPSPTEPADFAEIPRAFWRFRPGSPRSRCDRSRGGRTRKACAPAASSKFSTSQAGSRIGPWPARLARGLFAKPGVYPAIVRFANGESHVYPDSKPDVRALSFSIQVPPGIVGPDATRLDYSMNNATTFPINDAHAFATLLRFATAPSSAQGLLRVFGTRLLSFLQTVARGARQKRPATRAYQQTRYWSTVPFRHGPDEAVKYSAAPSADNPAAALQSVPDSLQEELLRHLSETIG